MEPIDYLRIVARRWRIVGACLLVALLGAWLTTPAHPSSTPVATSYEAKHTLIQNPAYGQPFNMNLARLFVTVGEVPRLAAKKLAYPGDPAVLAEEVTALEEPKDGTLVITSSDSLPAPAARLANVFAEELKAYLRSSAEDQRAERLKTIQSQLDALGKRADALKGQVSGDSSGQAAAKLQAVNDQLRTTFAEQLQQQSAGTSPPPLVTLQAATAIPVSAGGTFTAPTDRRSRLPIAGLLGLLLGAAAALVLERLDTRLRSRAAVENAFAFPVVAEVPRIPSRLSGPSLVLVRDQPETAQAEAYRGLRSSLLLLAPSGPEGWNQRERAAVILVTSGRPRDGKSTTVANLAASFAETGKSTLVLDCDLRAPDMHRILDVPQGAGITDLLASRNPGDLASLVRPTSVPGVRLVTSGLAAGHPGVLLAAAGDLIDRARDLCDVILIDTSPLLTANDTTDLLAYADTVLLVARYGRTLPENAHRMHELVTRLQVPVHGVCLTGTPSTTLQPMNASYSVDGRRFKDRLHTGRHQVPTTTPSRRGSRDPQDR